MGILDEDIARVRETVNIADVIGQHVALTRRGQRLLGRCPFHSEKTPSFSVNPEMGVYYCFGCQASGDAITFVREIEGLDFVEAVERLADTVGIEVRYDERTRSTTAADRAARVDVMEAAVDFYHRYLMEAPQARPARNYLRSRGFDGHAARRYKVGCSPAGWDELSLKLQNSGHSREDLLAVGLSLVNRHNRLQDYFRGRLMFPIFDKRDRPVGFGARLLEGDGPKYINSKDSPIYHKSRILYGLNWARGDIVSNDVAVVCEGYTDVMAFGLSGIGYSVATCGTALTDEHIQELTRFTRNIIIAYDADAAGQAAAARFAQWEESFDITLTVAALPAGADPADAWQSDAQALHAAVEGATPFLQFRLDRIFAATGNASIDSRGRTADVALAAVAEHPNAVVRDGYIMAIADRLSLRPEALRTRLAELVRGGPGRSAAHDDRRGTERDLGLPTPGHQRVEGPAQAAISPRDREVLWLAVHETELFPEWLQPWLLQSALARGVLQQILEFATIGEALEHSPEDTRAVLAQLMVEEPPHVPSMEEYASSQFVGLVLAAGQALMSRLARNGDERLTLLRPGLDRLREALNDGNWVVAEEAGEWVSEWIGAHRTGSDLPTVIDPTPSVVVQMPVNDERVVLQGGEGLAEASSNGPAVNGPAVNGLVVPEEPVVDDARMNDAAGHDGPPWDVQRVDRWRAEDEPPSPIDDDPWGPDNW
ncbi:MAG: DNA primase [Actinobacteria bacterium]|nr:DNA primase [Actinomycetota bacterium]MCB9388480.1 DNA primase [Acidimicrobiia bacterium]